MQVVAFTACTVILLACAATPRTGEPHKPIGVAALNDHSDNDSGTPANAAEFSFEENVARDFGDGKSCSAIIFYTVRTHSCRIVEDLREPGGRGSNTWPVACGSSRRVCTGGELTCRCPLETQRDAG